MAPDEPVLHEPPATPRRVLVIDDDAETTDMVCELLEHMGHQARGAYDASTGLDQVDGFQPDVVLLDLALPEMSGFEAVERLRRRSDGHGRLIVAITGFAQPADLQRARDAGFDHYLVKPVRLESLRAIVGEPRRDVHPRLEAAPALSPRSRPALVAEASRAFADKDVDAFATALLAIIEQVPEALAIDLVAVIELARYDLELATIRWSHLSKRLR